MVRSLLPLFAFALAASIPAFASELVPVPHFDGVDLRGGGNVTIVPGPVERVTILEGSTRFTRFYVEHGRQLRIDACNDQCPQLYHLRIAIESPHVPDLGVSGGGAIAVAPGFAPQRQLSTAVNGGGRIDTRALDVGEVSAAVNGGGELFVRARSALSGAVNGGGSVRYWGNPAVSTAIQGGGSVRPGY